MMSRRFGRQTMLWVGVCAVVGVLLMSGLVPSGGRDAPRLTASASPLSVTLTVNPQTVSEGTMFTVTAMVSGGQGPFTFNWNNLPSGCSVPGNVSSWTCSLSSAGQYSVAVSVSNHSGATGSATQSFSVTSSGGNGNGNGNGGSSSNNNGSNAFNLSSFGPILVYGLIAGIIVFALLVALTVGVIMIAVTLSRRLPRIPRHGVVCPSCHATAPGGSKFCPACASPLPPPT